MPLKVTAYEDEQSHRKVGIWIENPNADSLEHPIVQLINLVWINPDGVRQTIQIDQGNRGFRDGAYFHGNDHIPGHDHAIIYVAKAGDNMIEFLLSPNKFERWYSYDPDGGTHYATGNSDYEIELSVRGKVNNQRVEAENPPIKLATHFENNGRDNIRSATAKLVEHEQQETNKKTNPTKE